MILSRRSFLKVCAALGAATLPAASMVRVLTPVATGAGTFEWIGPEYFDYGRLIAVAIRLPDGRTRAARMPHGCGANKAEGDVNARCETLELKQSCLLWAESVLMRKAA